VAILQSEFFKFHDEIKLGTYDESKDLRDKRDLLINELKTALTEETLPGKEDKLTFTKLDQGSYAMNTGVAPKSGDYDIDVGICFDINNADYDSHKLKTLVFDMLDKQHNRNVDFNRPCITVRYADGYHVDLAIYAKNNDDMHIAWGKKTSTLEQCWYKSDPQGLTQWVKDVSSEKENREQYRRCVRALKKWKELKFSAEGNAAPPSIGLTIQARNAFNYKEGNDLAALIVIAKSIKLGFSSFWDQESESYLFTTSVKLPVQPYKNVYYKMTEKQLNSYYERICDLVEVLEAAESQELKCEASKLLRKIFGDDFPLVEDSKKTKKPYIPTGNNA